jgi:3-dehydroquinate synthase
MDRRLLKPLLLITVVLIVPVGLLAVHGEFFAQQLRQWQSNPPPRATLAAMVVAALAADVVLPVPSGPVSTLAGSQLGVARGAVSSALGMTIGAVIAFGLARSVSPFTQRTRSQSVVAASGAPTGIDQTAKADDSPQKIAADHGPWLLIVTRPLPLIAEAAVLLVGGMQMPWRTFLPVVTVANLAISLTYAVLGSYATSHGWLPQAICASIALPVALGLGSRRLRRSTATR